MSRAAVASIPKVLGSSLSNDVHSSHPVPSYSSPSSPYHAPASQLSVSSGHRAAPVLSWSFQSFLETITWKLSSRNSLATAPPLLNFHGQVVVVSCDTRLAVPDFSEACLHILVRERFLGNFGPGLIPTVSMLPTSSTPEEGLPTVVLVSGSAVFTALNARNAHITPLKRPCCGIPRRYPEIRPRLPRYHDEVALEAREQFKCSMTRVSTLYAVCESAEKVSEHRDLQQRELQSLIGTTRYFPRVDVSAKRVCERPSRARSRRYDNVEKHQPHTNCVDHQTSSRNTDAAQREMISVLPLRQHQLPSGCKTNTSKLSNLSW